ncbi:26S proteasome non-ATPase regulatory subunit 1-like protein A-like [Iris pallida]|uniref:26S proteasome non-ATPase regulatory subunit 1-like protein A-like n=1 Tax=Iris pallida TaxID=29817 RepID=A0AAX6FZ51_IRIPA|nr:26S proteasome non-ATPase regulatory subunit 1-like protein A-like [Iris pallida]
MFFSSQIQFQSQSTRHPSSSSTNPLLAIYPSSFLVDFSNRRSPILIFSTKPTSTGEVDGSNSWPLPPSDGLVAVAPPTS